MVTLDYALDIVMQLLPEQREMLMEMIRKQQIESRRKEIAGDARAAISEFHAGKLKPKTADEIIAELRADLTRETDEQKTCSDSEIQAYFP